MNTQQQAYINGFVKRAAQYGLNQNEAVTLLKQANFGLPEDMHIPENIQTGIGDLGNKLKSFGQQGADKIKDLVNNHIIDPIDSSFYNGAVGGLSGGMGIPHHVADYGMKTLNNNDLKEGVKNLFNNKYNSDVFAAEHPLLNGASEFLKSHNINPTMAAAGVGGAALLGGGYMLGKHLNKKKPQHQYQIEE